MKWAGFSITDQKKRLAILTLILSAVLSGAILLGTGLIPDWGKWYSDHLAFRWQTERILEGRVSLSDDPSRMFWDSAWGNESVQQIWGLGVPLWRLPFEAVARCAGFPGFPDRLAFAVGLFFITFFIVRFQFEFRPVIASSVSPRWVLLGLIPTIFFPPFLALCSSRFFVYEEVAAYGYLAGLLLMFWTARLWIRPGALGLIGLAGASALIMFIRPTLGAYGVASLAVGAIGLLRSDGRQNRAVAVAGFVFVCGIGLLLWSNMVRFGSPWEFGHALAVNGMPAMAYATRFSNPFASEGLFSSAKELFGYLFLTRSVVSGDPYAADRFPGQSPTFRWRELYFSTYDVIVFILVAAVWAWLLWRMVRHTRRTYRIRKPHVLEAVALWSLLAGTLLIFFYLRFPFLSSRYAMDFAPAFSGASWVLLWWLFRRSSGDGRRAKWSGVAILSAILFWWGYEMTTMKNEPRRAREAWTWEEVASQTAMDNDRPQYQGVRSPYIHSGGRGSIPLNGLGWWSASAKTKACVVLYVESPECIAIDVVSSATPDGNISTEAGKFDCIQARVGLELLDRESVTSSGEGTRIVFSGPKKKQFQSGVQMLSLAMVSPEELNTGDSKFRLLRVGWHRGKSAADGP